MFELFNIFFSEYIVYTKILQWFSFGNYISYFLKNFTDKAPYIESDIDINTLSIIEENALKNGYKLTYDKTPINSGTLALVFKGKIIKDGYEDEIVLKILRTNIRQKISTAISTITTIATILKFIPCVCKINLIDIINDMRNDLFDQSNFDKEIDSIRYIFKSTKNHRKIKQANVIDFLCNENCIGMNYIDGVNILRMNRDEKNMFIESTVMAFVHLTFKKMIFHLDLHPGNILFIKDGYRVSFLDMGMIMKLNIYENNFLYDLIQVMYNDFTIDDAVNMFKKHQSVIMVEKTDLETLIREILTRNPTLFRDKRIKSITIDIGKLLYELDTSSHKLNPTINKLLIGFMSFLGVCDLLDEDGKFRLTLLNVMKKI